MLRRGWWRHFVTDVLGTVLGPASSILAWLVWGQQGRSGQLLALALVMTAWGGYVGWAWGRRAVARLRTLRSGAPTLQLDGRGVWVRHPFGPSGGALLHWTDCVAVVVSRPPTRGRTSESYRAYVEFVPAAPDRVEGRAHPRDQRAELLERPADEALMVWLELTGVGRTAADVAAWLRRWRPQLRIIDSTQAHSASTL